jgi:hypothetical protein
MRGDWRCLHARSSRHSIGTNGRQRGRDIGARGRGGGGTEKLGFHTNSGRAATNTPHLQLGVQRVALGVNANSRTFVINVVLGHTHGHMLGHNGLRAKRNSQACKRCDVELWTHAPHAPHAPHALRLLLRTSIDVARALSSILNSLTTSSKVRTSSKSIFCIDTEVRHSRGREGQNRD